LGWPFQSKMEWLDSTLERTFDYFDRNIRYIQNLPYVVAGLGVIAIGRRIKVMKKFTSVKDVPEVFISQHVKLRGRVKSVQSDCTLQVEHLPILHNPLIKTTENASNSDLLVRLAGVRVIEHETVVKHLMNYQSSIVWIKMWQRRYPRDLVSEPYILCSIYRKKWPFNECINFTLLQMGVAEHYPMNAISSPLYRFNKRLNEAERYAKRRRLGVWHHPTRFQLFRENINNKVKLISTFIRNPFRKT